MKVSTASAWHLSQQKLASAGGVRGTDQDQVDYSTNPLVSAAHAAAINHRLLLADPGMIGQA